MKKRWSTLDTVLSILASVLGILSVVFGVLYNNAKNVTVEIEQADGKPLEIKVVDFPEKYNELLSKIEFLESKIEEPTIREPETSSETQASSQTSTSTTDPILVGYLIDVVSQKDWEKGRYLPRSSKESGKTDYFEMKGKTFYDGCTWDVSYGCDSYSVYTLNGNYTEISGTLGCVSSSSGDGSVRLLYFFDEVLQPEMELKPDMKNRPWVIKVAGVHELKIKLVSGAHATYATYGYGDVTIYK